MTETSVAEGAAAVESSPFRLRMKGFRKRLRRNWVLLCFMIPAVVVTFLFCYLPIYGVLIAFQDFMP